VRLEELEALHTHLKEVRLTKEDARYRRVMAAQWNADATEFDALHAVASWMESANSRLLEAGLDASTFSPLDITSAQIAVLSKSGERLARAQQLLDACSRHVTAGPIKDASATNTTFRNSKTWQERLQLLDSLAERLIQHAQLIARQGWSKQDVKQFLWDHCGMARSAESLDKAIVQCRAGNRIGDISYAVQAHCESHGFGVVRAFVGHGIGRALHEEPQVPNFGEAGRGPVLKAGMVLAIEPMVTMGSWEVQVLEDGWTAVTTDGSMAAHFEDTIAITENGPEVLTRAA
jgi:Xaa-Pro aminopeptidase